MSETDGIRSALNIPMQVNAGNGRIIEIRTLPAIKVVMLFDTILAAAREAYAQKDLDRNDGIAVMRSMIMRDPKLVMSLIAPATNASADELGDLDIDVFLEVVEAFIDKHRKVAVRFLDLGAKVAQIQAEMNPSHKRSMRSSEGDGAIPTSAS